MQIAILAVQGAFAEHRKKIEAMGVSCVELRKKAEILRRLDPARRGKYGAGNADKGARAV